MDNDFEARKNQPYPDRDPVDAEALRFTRSWHRHPALRDAICYEGVNLGEADEFLLFPEALKVFYEREQRR